MTPERVLDHPALVLDQRARQRYFDDGVLTVPRYVAAAWLDRLRAVVAAKIEASRVLTASDDQFDLAPDHSADKPNIRRLRKAVSRDQVGCRSIFSAQAPPSRPALVNQAPARPVP